MHARPDPRPVVLVAPPDSRRVRAFQATLQALGWPPARVFSYQQVLDHPDLLPAQVPSGAIVRIDSPGECLGTERLLLQLGQEQTESRYAVVCDVEGLDLEQGRLMPSRQWYQGLSRFFEVLQGQLLQAPAHQCTLHFAEALQLFDKRITSGRWQAAGLPVPRTLPEPRNFEHLLETMQTLKCPRVFVKLAHGSSASGAVALHVSGPRMRATSTVLLTAGGRLYNSRKLLQYTDRAQIQQLIEALCQHPLQVEAWIPKATLQGRLMDLRIVVVRQQPMHALVRLGQGAMTNLHLGNERGDLELLKDRLGQRWQDIEASCNRAMQLFPQSLYAGLDVLLDASGTRHFLLEGNAFGDYHRNVWWQGMDTFTAQLAALQEARPC